MIPQRKQYRVWLKSGPYKNQPDGYTVVSAKDVEEAELKGANDMQARFPGKASRRHGWQVVRTEEIT